MENEKLAENEINNNLGVLCRCRFARGIKGGSKTSHRDKRQTWNPNPNFGSGERIVEASAQEVRRGRAEVEGRSHGV